MNKMAIISTLKLSELEQTKRLDAEYYKQEYLENRTLLNKFMPSLFNLKRLSKFITNGHTPRYADLTIGEVYFLTAEDILDFIVNLQTSKRITKEDSHKILSRTILNVNDLLVTIKGKIGNAAVIYKLEGETNINQDIARIVLKDSINGKKVNPYFIATFINSKYGRKQVEQLSTSQINPFLGLANLKQIVIPFLCEELQNNIEKIVKKSLEWFYSSISIYAQAESLLIKELELEGFKFINKKSYTSTLSEVLSAHRVDAEYFQPSYMEVIRKIKNYSDGFDKLIKYAENIKPNFNPTKYPEQVFSYIELADIDSSIGLIHSEHRIKGKEAPSRARRLLKENDVIVSSVEGSLEKVALVDKDHDGCLASTGFFQFRPLDISPEALLVLSKSIILQSQLKKHCSGTILTAVPKEAIQHILIPNLSSKTQQKIALIVQKSHYLRKQAIELLEISKNAVEIAIEKNENEALEYIHTKAPNIYSEK